VVLGLKKAQRQLYVLPFTSNPRYNGSLVTSTVVSLTAAKFKSLIRSACDFALSYDVNISTVITLHYGCLLPT